MESLSKQSQQVYQQIEQQCGWTSNKDQIKRIYTSHVCQLEQKIKQLQLSIKYQQSKISDLNTQITNQIQSSKLQTQMFVNKLSNMEIHYQQLMELFNTAKYLQYIKQFTTSDVLKKYHINQLSLSQMNIQKNLMFRQGKIINSEGDEERQITQIPPLLQIMSQIPLVYQTQITRSNIHDYDFLPQLNTYYAKWMKRIRQSVQFKKSQHRDQIISSNEELKINNVHELNNLSIITMNYQYLKELNVSNSMLSDNHSQVFNQWYQLSLKKLDLSGNNITDKFIINIQYLLMQLISLNICFSDITNGSMKCIGYFMKECRKLDVSYTKVDEKGIQYIITLEKLEQLSIWSGQQHPECYRQYLLKNNEANLIRYKSNVIKIREYGIKLLSKMKLIKLTVDLNQQDGNIIVQQNNRLKYLHINGKVQSKSIINILEINKVREMEVVFKKTIVLGEIVRGKKEKISIEQLKKYIQDEQIIVEEIKIMGEQGYLKGQEIIRKFKLKSKRIGNEGAIQIARNLKCLTILSLSFNRIGNEGAIQIARNLKCLTSLNLWDNSIGKEGAIQIARNLKCLTTLNLSNNSIGNQGAIQIARNLKCLTTLNLSWNSIGNEGAIQIARNLKCLTILNLANNSIGNEGAIQIARNLKCLNSLNLSQNSIGKEGAIQIARNLKQLTSLSLWDNSIGNEGAIQIARNLKCLTILNLAHNSIGKEGAIQIARNLKCLTSLNLSFNRIGNQGAIQIARNLKQLTSLNLWDNSIGNEGAIQIARNLKALTILDLSTNSICKEGAILMATNLKCLTSLNLRNNNIDQQSKSQIHKLVNGVDL